MLEVRELDRLAADRDVGLRHTKRDLEGGRGRVLEPSPWGKHPRIQLLTVGELLAGKRIDYLHVALPLFGNDAPDESEAEEAEGD